MAKRSRTELDPLGPPTKRLRQNPIHLSDLPDEVVLKILSELPISSLAHCQRLSHQFAKLAVDPQIWKRKYYDRWVRPRALRIPGLRDPSADPNALLFSSKLSKWLDEGHLVKRGKETNWKRQYRLRQNWSKGSCRVSEVEVAEPPARNVLVKFHHGIIFTVDEENGLRAWSSSGGRTIVAEISLGILKHIPFKHPSALAVGSTDSSRDRVPVAVGFSDGSFKLFELKPSTGSFHLRYSNDVPGLSDVLFEFAHITSMALAGPYLLILAGYHTLSLFQFDYGKELFLLETELNPPRLLSRLKAYNIGIMVSTSLRTTSQGVVASIAYISRTISATSQVALQELRLSSSGDILGSRLASAVTAESSYTGFKTSLSEPASTMRTFSASVLYSSPPKPVRDICYSHPYLLVTGYDNTMTIYRVDSTAESLMIGPGRRLLGHTSGIAGAQVSGRGKAVSVSIHGDDIRIWELEEVIASIPSPRRTPKDSQSIRVQSLWGELEERERITKLSEAIERRGNGLGLALEEMSRWVGFDERQVVILKEKRAGVRSLKYYDFS